jgi:hypothetical protein
MDLKPDPNIARDLKAVAAQEETTVGLSDSLR